jgi:tetratricopeptide (TPR) repeat protein
MKVPYIMKQLSFIVFLILICTFNLIVLVYGAYAEEPKRIPTYSTQNESEAYKFYQLGTEALDIENYSKAILYYSKSLEFDSFNSLVYYERAFAYEYIGELDQAIFDLTSAIEIDNYFDGAYFNRGIVWEKKGEFSKAIKDYTAAIEINPKDPWYFFKRAYVKRNFGDYKGAIEDYNQSIKLSPNLYNAYNNLSWLYSTCLDSKYRDGDKALSLAQISVELKREGSTLDTLAAAHAELGNFGIAVKIQDEVLTFINKTDEPDLYMSASTKLSHYKSKLPWREQ